MSAPSHFDQLREAVKQERSEEALRAERCEAFMQRVMLYQRGLGELPDEQEFLLWREDLKKAMAVKALRAAMPWPAENDPG